MLGYEWPNSVFGVAPPGGEMAEHHTRFEAGLGYPRFFFGPGKRAGWGAFPLNRRVVGDTPVVSVKTWNAADFAAMLTNTPANVGDWWFCINHEPEDEMTAGSLTLATLLANYRQARVLLDSVPNSRCRLILILNWYQITQRGFNTTQFDPILELVDAIGVDSYALRDDGKIGLYTPPGALFGPAVDLAVRASLPWAVPEFAVAIAADKDQERHARIITRYAGWMLDHGALWCSYWCNPAGGYTPHICTDPLYAAAFARWRSLM